MRARRLIRRRRPPDLDAVADQADRLAALAAAGASPSRAFSHLAAGLEGDDRDLALAAAGAAGRGEPVAPVFAAAVPLQRRQGAAVGLAIETGAPLGPVLRASADGLRAAVELQRAVAESVSGPAASARLVLLLPPVALLLGWGFGFDVPAVLLGGPVGAVLLAAGLALIAAAGAWSRRLIRRASAVDWTVGLQPELLATALRAGLPVPRARALADAATRAAGLPPSDDPAALEGLIDFAADAGLPLAALLDAEADRQRRRALAAARLQATVLATRLLLPLGLLVLPAFLLLGAAPVGLAILRGTRLAP